ncbi:protein MLP2-like [Pogonomyrmex barbatus]|uniref:Protein MLP2-like n=1 Tax=Pogonomyrmex barbatus TaxID=144034 RepID=A0A8N1SC03_9HYME|nr:protein MLP2-like [Pogonomyrmex barbatus]
MLFDEIRALREKDHVVNESILEMNVKTLISQQEKEIENLRNQLLERLTPGMENMQVKLQAQENHWKSKIEDMETQHRQDIERLTTELKATQQVADRIKSEYTFKVYDLEKQSMDQSNMLVEQREQLNSLSRKINNSQAQISSHKIKEKNIVEEKYEEFHESPLQTIKHDSNYNENKTYKSLNHIKNTEVVIEDIDSESSQEYNKKVSALAQSHVSSKNNTVKCKGNKKIIIDDSKTVKHMVTKPNLKKLDKSEVVKKTKKNVRHDALNDITEINRTSKSFNIKENFSNNVNKKYIDAREKKETLNTDSVKNKFEFLERHSVSSTTESESLSFMAESETDSESVTADDGSVKKYESSTVKSSNIRRISMQEDAQSIFNNRLRELGIDPEWQGIPMVTFRQKMEIIKHQQNINAKKIVRYNQIKQKILEDVRQRISANYKRSKYSTLTKNSPLNKLITQKVKSKSWKAFNKDNGEYTSIQKTENTTPLKSRLKRKIELLPKKYKDEQNTRELPLKKNGRDIYTSPKMISTSPQSIQNISSTSSIESRDDVKQISPTKITVLDIKTRKVSSPISKKQVAVSKFSENDNSDSTIIQDDLVFSPKNNKSVLKPTSGSVGSLVKKKVLFDLDDKKNDATMSENNQRKNQINNDDWIVSSFTERKDYTLQKEKSMSTGNIVLKTSQSDKIAEISKKIQEQLRVAKKPPAGSIETIFRFNTSSQDLVNYNTGNQFLNSTSRMSSILNSPVQNFTSPKAKDNVFPQPAPRTMKDRNLIQSKSEMKYSDLDSDINEILQME